MSQTDITSNMPRILVVDDSRIVRATVKKHLSTQFDIVEEADGEAGWSRLEADPEILVMMTDLSMPKLDGFGLLGRVRKSQDARIKHTPVIVISGEEDLEVKQQALERGANDFVTKSTDRAEMLARVSAAAKLARTARELRATEESQARTATTDVQTGLATEHMLHVEGDKAMAHAARYHGETTLVLFELDKFDEVTGELGEAAAGQLINLVAKLVAGKLRKEETLARLDGPCFAVMLYANFSGATIYAERLKETIAAAKVNFRGQSLRITASIALANSVQDGLADFDGMLALAQLRLARKRAGVVQPLAEGAAQPADMSVAEALALIAQGKEALVLPQLPRLLESLQPLLALASTPTA